MTLRGFTPQWRLVQSFEAYRDAGTNGHTLVGVWSVVGNTAGASPITVLVRWFEVVETVV